MENKDFTTTILVAQSPSSVFDAVTSPQQWWAGEIEGKSSALGDEFTYRYKDFHMSKQRVVAFIPEKKIEWLVTESVINYVVDKDEWTGTRIVFEILPLGDKTQLRFTHIGLHPNLPCFESCSTTWANLLQRSLFGLITTGKAEKLVLG